MVSDNMAVMSEIKNKDRASVFFHMMKLYKQTSKDVTDYHDHKIFYIGRLTFKYYASFWSCSISISAVI
ncbi:hypothetical protein KY285_017601 [Solanum tuberosum]|nr:hypothetical protein KY285_017601 [Solanum tuberosum]